MLRHDFIILLCSCSALAALDGYSQQQDADQIHIQTDDNNERYFLYQTNNGQYRRERVLKDGSVIGTTGWVDADGYLRLQDYIADAQGYRVFKSKTVFVGVNRPMEESLDIAKSAPTDAGYGVKAPPSVPKSRGLSKFSTKTPLPVTTYRPSFQYPQEVSITPSPPTYANPSTPLVEISPNSIDTSPTYNFKPTPPPVAASTSSPSPNTLDYETNSLDGGYYGNDNPLYSQLDVFNPNSYRHANEWLRRQRRIKVGDGYSPQFNNYDGVAFRKNGFRYYLPKQYHEEETGNENEKAGSFGYVDPFGIRRVIYYNTVPGEGFQVRKNNRFVGHEGTPYDSRPVQ